MYEKLASISRGIRCAGVEDDENDNDNDSEEEEEEEEEEEDDDDDGHGHGNNIKLVVGHTLVGEGLGWVKVYFI